MISLSHRWSKISIENPLNEAPHLYIYVCWDSGVIEKQLAILGLENLKKQQSEWLKQFQMCKQ